MVQKICYLFCNVSRMQRDIQDILYVVHNLEVVLTDNLTEFS